MSNQKFYDDRLKSLKDKFVGKEIYSNTFYLGKNGKGYDLEFHHEFAVNKTLTYIKVIDIQHIYGKKYKLMAENTSKLVSPNGLWADIVLVNDKYELTRVRGVYKDSITGLETILELEVCFYENMYRDLVNKANSLRNDFKKLLYIDTVDIRIHYGKISTVCLSVEYDKVNLLNLPTIETEIVINKTFNQLQIQVAEKGYYIAQFIKNYYNANEYTFVLKNERCGGKQCVNITANLDDNLLEFLVSNANNAFSRIIQKKERYSYYHEKATEIWFNQKGKKDYHVSFIMMLLQEADKGSVNAQKRLDKISKDVLK